MFDACVIVGSTFVPLSFLERNAVYLVRLDCWNIESI